MTHKQIIRDTLEFKPTDVQPYWIPIYGDKQEEISAHFGSDDWKKKIKSFIDGGHHAGMAGEDMPDGRYRDAFGYYTENNGHIMTVTEIALKEPCLDGYTMPDGRTVSPWDTIAEHFESMGDTFRICGCCFGFFERGQFIRGVENLLMDMIENPQFVHDLFDMYLEFRLQVLDKLIETVPLEGIFDGGDDCDQRGPMMGLPRWQEFIKPRLKAVIDFAHAKGLPVVAHMCGNVEPLIDDLMEIKLDALESLQPEPMDLLAIKKKTQGKMALIGGMGVQHTLPFGTVDEVRAATRKLKREMYHGGGYILGPAKPVMDEVPVENAIAFIEEAIGEPLG